MTKSKKAEKTIIALLIGGILIKLGIFLITQVISRVPVIQNMLSTVGSSAYWKDLTGNVPQVLSNPRVGEIIEKVLQFFGLPAILLLLVFLIFGKPIAALLHFMARLLSGTIIVIKRTVFRTAKNIDLWTTIGSTDRTVKKQLYVRLIDVSQETPTEELLDVTRGTVSRGNLQFEPENTTVHVYEDHVLRQTIAKGEDWIMINGKQIKAI